MAAVHSSCRLCIQFATMIQEKEETGPGFKRRPCRCTRGSETVYHLYVRERGRFEMESIFLRYGKLTPTALEAEVLKKFKSLKHVPIWKQERPERIRGDNLKVYRVYPVGMTQRQALYTFKFNTDDDFKNHLEVNPCAKFEVIFVKILFWFDTAMSLSKGIFGEADKQQQQLKESIDELDSRDEQQLEPRRSCRIPKKNRRFIEL